MHCTAYVLECRIAQDGDLAGFRIDLHVNQIGGDLKTNRGRVHRYRNTDRAAGMVGLTRDFRERQRLARVMLVGEYTLRTQHILSLGFPYLRHATRHFLEQFLRRLDYRQASRERRAATHGLEGITNRVGIRHAGGDARYLDTQCFSGLHAQGHARATQVATAGGQIDRAIRVQRHLGARHQACAKPEGEGNTASLVGACQRRRVMRMFLDRFKNAHRTQRRAGKAQRHHVAGLEDVLQPEIDWIHLA